MHPILFSFGSFHIAAYGVFVAAAYLMGILWLKSQIRWMGLTEDEFWLLAYYLFFGAIAGGKLMFMAVEYKAFLSGALRPIRDFRYGFVFFGGLLGSAAMCFLAQRKLKFDYLAVADYFGVALPMGHALGRLGCLGAGCCYGRPTSLPWGIALGGNPASSTPRALWGIALHPTQVYESLANLAIFLFLWKRVLPRVQRKELVAGTVFLGYVALYSAARFAVEFYRYDDRGATLPPLSISQWVSLAGLAVACGLLARRGVRRRA